MITITNEMLQGTGSRIISQGETTDEFINCYGWGDRQKQLKFVVVKGHIDDWCVYVEAMERDQTIDQVRALGNKLIPETASKLIDCSNEVWARYRR